MPVNLFGEQMPQSLTKGALVTSAAHKQQIKNQLLSGRRITVQSVLRSIGTQELRTYIPILRRRDGLDIGSRWLEKNGKHFKEYFLNQIPVQAVG